MTEKDEIFISATRSAGDQAGVFELEGGTGYFYLYETNGTERRKINAAIRVVVGKFDFREGDFNVRWDADENMVGLFIRGRLWAVFDAGTGAKFGGDYRHKHPADIPAGVANAFETK